MAIMAVAKASLLCSPFRPFFLFGTLYGVVLLTTWLFSYTELLPDYLTSAGGALPLLYHQHEMIFGFACAIIIGFVMTALPSWAGTNETTGIPLILLVASWVLGRLAVTLAELLPSMQVALMDLVFPLLFIAVTAPGLGRARLPYQLGLAVIVAGFFTGNLCYYLGVLRDDPILWSKGLTIGLYAMVFHCSVTVGILAPIFTENALREQGKPAAIGHCRSLEWLSASSIVALAALDIADAPESACVAMAIASGLVHLARLARWRSLSIVSTPIVWVLHLGYAWLCIALLMLAASGAGLAASTESWVHAFTIGGFGSMSLGLMVRVSRKHTGRDLRVPAVLSIAFGMLTAATLLRVSLPLGSLREELLLLSALLWVLPYLIYLALCGPVLIKPSLPQQKTSIRKELPAEL